MKSSGNLVLGFIIIMVGLNLLFSQLGIRIDVGSYIWPIIAASISYHFYKNKNKWLSLLFLSFCVISLGDTILNIDLGGFIIAVVLLYFGIKLLKGQDFSEEIDIDKDLPPQTQEHNDIKKDTVDQTPHLHQKKVEKDELPDEHITEAVVSNRSSFGHSSQPDATIRNEPIVTPSQKNIFIGDFKLMKRTFALQDMNLKYGIGDIAIDFSKAIVDEGETVVVLHGGIGDVDLYIPSDLNISIQASASLGDINVFKHREEGINKQAVVQTENYKESNRKVKIIISVILGDIDVRYV
ncbi:lia operon protein LiaF [Salibacterium salarium]|nr:lia operon protein LiaF [Salibacterium salarium]